MLENKILHRYLIVLLKAGIKSNLSKLNFWLGRTPLIEQTENYRKYIPKPYKAVVIISADFELAWAWQWSKVKNPLELVIEKAQNARKNIPLILDLCKKYNIPITWATVGHLFLPSCNINSHKHIKTLKSFENQYWKFEKEDWFANDPYSNYKKDPYWYAPDLIQQIINSPVKHEIACHTFSHIDCRNGICSDEVFNGEVDACKKEAEKLNIRLRSFVHPAHTIGNLDNLVKQGFTNFRTDYRNVLSYPKKHNNGLWEFEQTAEFIYRRKWSIDYHIYRYIEIIKRAIKFNTVCVYWFHPSFDTLVVEKILPPFFDFIEKNKQAIWITTHNEYVNWLNNTNERKN